MHEAWLDTGRHHALSVSWRDGGARVSLSHDGGDRRSPLHDALRRHLVFRVGERAMRLGDDDALTFAGASASVSLGAITIADLTPERFDARYLLSPLECRFLADNGVPHPSAPDAAHVDATPRTDLHSHFAGCVSGAHLVEMGVEHGVTYPRALLAELGIRCEGDGDVELGSLPAPMRALLARRLTVPHDRQITFLEMERFYRARSPLTKSPRLLVPQLDRIASDYARAGVTYAELSFSDVVRGATLRAICESLPAVEARHGVTLRFLAANSRHDDLEWDLDVIDRLEEIARCPYLVGLDVMGHETTSTRTFARQLREASARMSVLRPGFVVRVHAGESPAYPANVRDAIELTRGHDVRLRIGHGLYGVDGETLDMLRREDVIVEFNLTSNFSLNNVQSLEDVPLARYARAGVPVVLGSDGPGLYGTDARLEARAARLAGIDEETLSRIQRTERAYTEERLGLDRLHARSDFVVTGDLVHRHYDPSVAIREREARAQRDAVLRGALTALGVPLLDDSEVDAILTGRRCVSIAGSWKSTWESTPEDAREAIVRELAALLDGLRHAVIVTGGTRFGVEHEVQRLARERGVDVLAAIVADAPVEGLSGDVRWATCIADGLYAKAAALYERMRHHDGACVFVGGGPIVNDEIQSAQNLRVDVLLMDGPPGASTRHAREQPERAFRTADEALARLAQTQHRPAPFWHRGPNPTADVVLARRDGDRVRVLAIRRDVDAPSEPGRWALPGGFVQTDAPRGDAWHPGRESALDAALRELFEESGLDLFAHADALRVVGVYEGGGRDPRDRADAWSRSTAFAAWLPDDLYAAPIAGGDDASDARWLSLDEVDALAFDHPCIVADALRLLGT